MKEKRRIMEYGEEEPRKIEEKEKEPTKADKAYQIITCLVLGGLLLLFFVMMRL